MKIALLVITCVCIMVVALSPIASYLFFSDRLIEASESFVSQISDLQHENERLRQEIEQLKQDNEEPFNPYSVKAFLVTELGWYLHDSNDPVNYSRNKLTIYGHVYNVGATNAIDCKLIVALYDRTTLLQRSEVDLGLISHWSRTWVRRDIDCELADSVTKIEVERTWRNMT